MQLNVIPQETEGFDDIVAGLEASGKKFNYNEFASAYNTVRVGDLAHIPFEKDRFSGFKKQMEKRGIVIGVDASFYTSTIEDPVELDEEGKAKLDADGNEISIKDAEGNIVLGPEHVFFRRLTDKEASQIEIKQAGRKKAPAGATTTGTAAGATGADAPKVDAKGATGAATAPAKKGASGKK